MKMNKVLINSHMVGTIYIYIYIYIVERVVHHKNLKSHKALRAEYEEDVNHKRFRHMGDEMVEDHITNNSLSPLIQPKIVSSTGTQHQPPMSHRGMQTDVTGLWADNIISEEYKSKSSRGVRFIAKEGELEPVEDWESREELRDSIRLFMDSKHMPTDYQMRKLMQKNKQMQGDRVITYMESPQQPRRQRINSLKKSNSSRPPISKTASSGKKSRTARESPNLYSKENLNAIQENAINNKNNRSTKSRTPLPEENKKKPKYLKPTFRKNTKSRINPQKISTFLPERILNAVDYGIYIYIYIYTT